MKAIILVGGLGTRLQSVLPDLPKSMAPINHKPFLAYLLNYLGQQGITHVIFSVHYLHEKIQNYFHAQYGDIAISYAKEEKLLGTGGAIVNALATMTIDEPLFVLNGDTFVKLDYQAMYLRHVQSDACLTVALHHVADCHRYGKIISEGDRITSFKEKGEMGPGLINAGVYLINPTLFSSIELPTQFSFEKDFLFTHLNDLSPHAFITNDYFIDIGIPDDYARAQKELALA